MKHWTAAEVEKIMRERALDIPALSVLSGISRTQIYSFFAGTCLLTIQNIEKLLSALGHELEIMSDGSPNPAIECFYCGIPVIPVEVHGHTQCPKCQAILARCCED